ncbi:unnamed protein product [Calypogeia fissa]
MAAAIACASTSLARLVLRLSSNALTGKVNVCHVSMKAKATDSIWYGGDHPKYLASFSAATPAGTELGSPPTPRHSPRT